MKRVLTLVLMSVLTLSTAVVSAQKQASVRIQEVIMAMPEIAKMQTDLELIRQDFASNLETMQVELNNKIAEYQQSEATMNASVRSLKESDMQDLDNRMRQFEQSAIQEIQAKQNEMLAPIILKAREAVSETAKAGGYTMVIDAASDSFVYFNPEEVTDLTYAVKVRLGLEQ